MRKARSARILAAAVMLAGMAAALCACGPVTEPKDEAHFFAMDTAMTVTVYGTESAGLAAKTEELITSLDRRFSRTDPESELWSVNAAAGEPVPVSDEFMTLLGAALAVAEETDRALDVTIAPVMDLWGFAGEEKRVPEEAALGAALAHVNSNWIHWESAPDGTTVRLREGMALDFGGIAKGYAAHRAAAELRASGCTSAILRLGGNIQLVGAKPDGTDWRIGVQDPFDAGKTVGVLSASDTAVVTSGSYQRYFEEGGLRYHHILDPSTGHPADNGLVSVTVVCADGTRADALSTALFVMGEERALAHWRGHRDFELVLITEDRRLVLTEGLRSRFEPGGGEYAVEYAARTDDTRQ